MKKQRITIELSDEILEVAKNIGTRDRRKRKELIEFMVESFVKNDPLGKELNKKP